MTNFASLVFRTHTGDRLEGPASALQHGGVAGLRAASHAASAAAILAPARP